MGSQLEQDTSTALRTIREWKNSFVPINRVPSEVLSLIPTHFLHVRDLFRATAVCHHWRRTFIQHAALWSRIDLTVERDDGFVKTLLERAKGSALDISTSNLDPLDTLTLLSPHAQRFRTLNFNFGYWVDIEKFSEAVSGPLPLLRALIIDAAGWGEIDHQTIGIPPLPLFSGAVDLEKLILCSKGIPHLNHFTFPNLTTFELCTTSYITKFPVSQLLDFLEASPTLRKVRIEIEADMDTGDVPPERLVVLPNVGMFTLVENEPGFKVAAYISCPSARRTSLIYARDVLYTLPGLAFSTSAPWNAIVAQYTASPIDEVVLSIITTVNFIPSCSLSFISPGPAILELGYRIIYHERYSTEGEIFLENNQTRAFSRACMTIRNYLLLGNIRRLRIQDSHIFLPYSQLARVAEEAIRLFTSMGPLEELSLDVVDLRPYLAPFLDLPEFQEMKQPDAFPAIKELTITERSKEPLQEECMAAIVEWAKSQYALGVPFERVIFRMKDSPVAMVERLGPWVGTVHSGEEMIIRDDPV